jgi:hypothetical protein
MNELLDNNPTQQEIIKGELDLTFIQVADIDNQLNDVEARLSNYLPPAEMARLGRMATGLKQHREEITALFPSLTIKISQLEELTVPAESQPGIADDHTFNDAVAEIIANLPPINLVEVEQEVIIGEIADERPPTEVPPITELIQPIEVQTPKSKTSKSGNVNKNKSAKHPKPVVNQRPNAKKPKPNAKPRPKATTPSPKRYSSQHNRHIAGQDMMEIRRRYLESLDRATAEPIILTDRQKLNPNLDVHLLKFLMGQGKKPAQHSTHKKMGVTIGIFLETPIDQRQPGWQKRILEAQVA